MMQKESDVFKENISLNLEFKLEKETQTSFDDLYHTFLKLNLKS